MWVYQRVNVSVKPIFSLLNRELSLFWWIEPVHIDPVVFLQLELKITNHFLHRTTRSTGGQLSQGRSCTICSGSAEEWSLYRGNMLFLTMKNVEKWFNDHQKNMIKTIFPFFRDIFSRDIFLTLQKRTCLWGNCFLFSEKIGVKCVIWWWMDWAEQGVMDIIGYPYIPNFVWKGKELLRVSQPHYGCETLGFCCKQLR